MKSFFPSMRKDAISDQPARPSVLKRRSGVTPHPRSPISTPWSFPVPNDFPTATPLYVRELAVRFLRSLPTRKSCGNTSIPSKGGPEWAVPADVVVKVREGPEGHVEDGAALVGPSWL